MIDLRPESWGSSVNGKGHLLIGGCDSVELADEYGTPLYVINEMRLQENYDRFYEAFASRYPKVQVFYSYKTNCVPGVLKVLHERQAKAEVISGYELWLALKMGVNPDSIVYNGPNKTREELETAIGQGIKLINADSIPEIERIDRIAGELGTEANLGIRVCLGVVPKGMGPGTATGSRKSQFGVDLKTGEALQAFEKAESLGNVNLLGMHCHIGSGVKDPKSYVMATKRMLRLASEVKRKVGKDIQYLDIGGGFGTPCHQDFTTLQFLFAMGMNRMPRPPNPRSCPSINVFAQMIAQTLRKGCREYALPEPTLILEPGRYLTGDSQVLLLRVGVIKDRPEVAKFALTDGGIMSTSIMLLVEYHKVFLANKMNAVNTEKYSVFGRVCTTADWLYKGIVLPSLSENDLLAVMDTGAYFVSTGNNFAYPRPPVLMARDGKARMIRRRESYEDLMRNDILLDR